MYKSIQDLFRRGLVTLVGSGASCALGLPSMAELSDHLQVSISSRSGELDSVELERWRLLLGRLSAGQGLEAALEGEDVPENLGRLIADEIASAVGLAETAAISGLMSAEFPPVFGRLFKHLLHNNVIADVITTNYDRLLEVAAAISAIRVDTMFYGHTLGRLDERLSREELLVPVQYGPKSAGVRLQTRPHIRLAKPHGSLDWFAVADGCVRSEIPTTTGRQIIAPGGSKYRLGYDIPFDRQRQRANDAIDRASAFLAIGYGFNDAHLQTHMLGRFAHVPSLTISKTLSPRARDYLSLNPESIGIEANPDGAGALVSIGTERLLLAEELWQLDVLMREVLGV